MVKIQRGDSVRLVSEGAYKSFYQRAGWKPVNAAPETDPAPPPGNPNTGNSGKDAELLALRERGNALKIPYASQMGMEKLLAAIADKEKAQAGGGTPAGNGGELTDAELLEIPASEMKPEELERAADIIGFDYKAAGFDATKLQEKLPELLAAR
jgi:hypothetical protein